MKIYVVEGGCRYEGGSALAASTDFVSAWKYLREQRVSYERDRSPMRLMRKLGWVGKHQYLCIKEYDDIRLCS